jgi:glycosyltransferase involved in cell wall biosynthesis
MAAYNAEATIGRALRSLAAQTLPDWEAVVDDGSADRTWSEIERWMARDPRIHGIRLSANEKAPGASNHVIAAARGDWIAVLDADDWIGPARLATLIGVGEALGCDVVADNQILFDAGARTVVDHEPSYIYVQPLGSKSGTRQRRTHYRYDLMRRHTDQAISRYGAGLAPAALRNLRRRSRAISRFAAYLGFRDAMADGAIGEALSVLARNPACLHAACVAVMVHLGLMKRVIPRPPGRPDLARNLAPRVLANAMAVAE